MDTTSWWSNDKISATQKSHAYFAGKLWLFGVWSNENVTISIKNKSSKVLSSLNIEGRQNTAAVPYTQVDSCTDIDYQGASGSASGFHDFLMKFDYTKEVDGALHILITNKAD